MRLRHFRDGKELPVVFEDMYYDFEFQHFKSFEEEVHILPGDEFAMECHYDTRGAEEMVLGGKLY